MRVIADGPEPQADKPILCKLFAPWQIAINGKFYNYDVLDIDDVEVLGLVTLQIGSPFMDDFETYDVSLHLGGYYECTCADFTYRGSKSGVLCKHVVACRECGLIENIQLEK